MLESGFCAFRVATNAVVFGLVDPLDIVFFVEEKGGGDRHAFEACGPADRKADRSKEKGLELHGPFMQETYFPDDLKVRVTEQDKVEPVFLLVTSGSVGVVFA